MGSAAVGETLARPLDAPLATSPDSRVPGYAVAGSLSYGVLNRGTVAQVDRCEGLSQTRVWSPVISFLTPSGVGHSRLPQLISAERKRLSLPFRALSSILGPQTGAGRRGK